MLEFDKLIILVCYLLICFMIYILYPQISLFKYISTFIFLSLFVIFIVLINYLFIDTIESHSLNFIVTHFIYFVIILILFFTIKTTIFVLPFKYIFILYLLVFSLLAAFFNYNGKIKFNSEYFKLFIYILFYLIFIFKDFIQFIINDVKETKKTTYIILFLLIIFIFYINYSFIFYSLFSSNKNAITLVNKKTKLNKKILSIHKDTIQEKLNTKNTLFNNKENFYSISNYETQNANEGVDILKNNIFKLKKYFSFDDNIQNIIHKYDDDPELMRKKINEEVNKNIYLKVKYTLLKYKNMFFLTDEISRNENDMIMSLLEQTKNTYHYGISFWLYLNSDILTDETSHKDLILSYGSRPSLYYDYNEKCLIIEFIENNEDSKKKRLYKSEKLLFQKWNHVVMNYVNGQYDLFINNELVSTHSNIVPYINFNEKLIIGDEMNKDLGAISKVLYFEQPLTQSKINSIYNSNDY